MLRQPAKGSAPPLPQPKCAVPKKRGSYNCGRCGLPKKGHVCSSDAPPPRSDSRLRRALSYDDLPEEVAETVGVKGEEVEEEDEWGMLVPLPGRCLVEVLRRLPLKELIGASAVCRGWKECVRRVWRSAEELRLRVSPRSQIGFVGSLLPKCSGLTKLALTLERLGFYFLFLFTWRWRSSVTDLTVLINKTEFLLRIRWNTLKRRVF